MRARSKLVWVSEDGRRRRPQINRLGRPTTQAAYRPLTERRRRRRAGLSVGIGRVLSPVGRTRTDPETRGGARLAGNLVSKRLFRYNPNVLGNRLAVGQRTLDPLAQVRILDPQLLILWDTAHSSSGQGHRPLKAKIRGSNPLCATTDLC